MPFENAINELEDNELKKAVASVQRELCNNTPLN